MARLSPPTRPVDDWPNGEYYTDGNDMRWQYSQIKKRWSLAPATAISTAYTSSSTPPANRELPWFNPDDGTMSVWVAAYDAWVVTSGDGTDGEDGEDLTTVAGVVVVDTATHILVTANLDKYNRLTYSGGTLREVTVGEIGAGFAAVTGSIVTLRNHNEITLVTIVAGVGVTLNYAVGANTLGPRSTAQLLCVSAENDEWDIL